jgi:hypothetical protein
MVNHLPWPYTYVLFDRLVCLKKHLLPPKITPTPPISIEALNHEVWNKFQIKIEFPHIVIHRTDKAQNPSKLSEDL